MEKRTFVVFCLCLMLSGLNIQTSWSSDWPSWRGANHTGVSDETGLVSNWSLDGDNLVWRADFKGRSTPIVMNGKVYVLGRTGVGVDMQRVVACYDAKDGRIIWENKENLLHTTIPFTRVGWASLGGDQETGNVYLYGVDGMLTCYNGENGQTVWKHSLVEEFHRFSGYGGRTNTPIIDEDLVHISFWTWSAWGEKGPPKPRFAAYDKHTGELVWVTYLGNPPKNTNYSNPVIALINGVRTMVTGGPDGKIYGVKARTGEILWKFRLSKGAIQSSVVVDGNMVYASHSAENFDNESFGRVVCIDANGSGDITETNEVWRYDAIDVGYASSMIHDGRLYVVSNAGNLLALDAKTGKEHWVFNLGTVGKGSPVWADGKIFATEVNGGFHIIEPRKTEAKSLDRKQIAFNESRAAEVYSSPAIAYGRVFFTTEEGLYCIGDKNAQFEVTKSAILQLKEEPPTNDAAVAHIQIVPVESWINVNRDVNFKVRSFDDKGRRLGEKQMQFTLSGLNGKITGGGNFTPDKNAGIQAGYVTAKVGNLESKARVQVYPDLPLEIDFENFKVDKNPPFWPNASKFIVKDLDGNKVLMKPPSGRGLHRHNLFFTPPELTGYTIQADMKAVKVKRRSPDMGLIANRYYFDYMTKKKRLQIRAWPAELERLKEEIRVEWNPDLWYTMKLRVDIEGDKAVIKGKVWPRDEPEPKAWTMTAEDPHANKYGSPALYGDAPTPIYFDNIKITKNQQEGS